MFWGHRRTGLTFIRLSQKKSVSCQSKIREKKQCVRDNLFDAPTYS